MFTHRRLSVYNTQQQLAMCVFPILNTGYFGIPGRCVGIPGPRYGDIIATESVGSLSTLD